MVCLRTSLFSLNLRGASDVILGHKIKNEVIMSMASRKPIPEDFSTANIKKTLFPPHFHSFWHPCVPGNLPRMRG